MMKAGGISAIMLIMIDSKSIKQPFWAMSVEETFKVLETTSEGLTEEESIKRFKIFGPNKIKDGKRFSKFKLLYEQTKSPLILILIFAGLTTAFLRDWIDMGVILATVMVNISLGFYQENKAENILELLKSYVKTRTRVKRLNQEEIIDALGLVPGDIIRISQGDKVPADGRIFFASNFEVDESVLTGESVPAEKSKEPVAANASTGDKSSMVFGSTLAVGGYANVIVTSTAKNTEFGKIASLLAKKGETKTPLQIAISRFSYWAGFILLILIITLFSLGLYYGYQPLEMFLISVAIAVSAVPEGLPIALTVIMAIGVEQLAKKQGVVRKLLAAETLGSTSLILTDKTGTLTQAKMELAGVIPYKNSSPEKMKDIILEALTTVDVVLENPENNPDEWKMFGNFMEIALVQGAAKKGIYINEVFKTNPIFDRLNFSSDRKYAASVHDHNGTKRMMLLGAPEILIHYTNLSEEDKAEVIEEINERAFSGERILGVISNEPILDYESLRKYDFKNFNFDGLITFRDPLRIGVSDAIREIGEAGVRTILVTGDHHGTAEAVAREVGLIDGKGAVLTGDDLNHLSKEELYSRADSVSVFARVTPEQKVAIVKMYQEKGEIVAMTGDGVNDAPALNVANIGIAVGAGTDVTKSAADLVILDNNYETIVSAIAQGRRILDNIKKVIVYLLSNSLDELFLVGGAIFTGVAMPISAIQILFVNFFSDSFPAIAFAFENEIDGLGNKPRKLSSNLFDRQMKFLLLGVGIITSALLFVMYYYLLETDYDPKLIRTFIFASFSTYTLLVSFSFRSLNKSIFQYNPFSNKYLVGGVLMGIMLTLAAIYLPFLSRIMNTVPLPMSWLAGVAVVGGVNILLVELSKWLYAKIFRL